MAAKSRGQATITEAKKTTPPKPLWKIIGSAAAFMALAALASPVSQANLSPVYGSIPSAIYHQQGTTIVALAAFIATKLPARQYLPSNTRIFLPIFAYYIPLIQWALYPFSKRFGAEFGPLITESLTFYPLLFLACVATSVVLDELDLSRFPRTVTDGGRPAVSYLFFSFAEKMFSRFLPQIIGKADFMSRSGLNLMIASFYAAIARSPYLLISVPAMLHTMFANPHHQSPSTAKIINKTLVANNYTLLERRDSLTGYISVLEDKARDFRVLRCDHSLLGGDWLVNEERKTQGQTKRESIYSVFTMLESVRLVERIGKKDSEANALFIGLGIGTSPTAFINHGINTTIVELDPVVHEFAMRYFELPGNHTAAIEDAVDFVGTESNRHPKTYDYIIHDVFTGGAEPTALFTLEFLQGLDKMLKDDGVVAINYAGDLTLPPPRVVLSTIYAVFPTCRIFRDSPEDLSDPSNTFINMVVFCTKSASQALTFRKATDADWMGSLSRREFIPPAANLEIKLKDIVGEDNGEEGQILKRGDEGIIEKYHREAAVRHWGIMRTVLPDAIWENW